MHIHQVLQLSGWYVSPGATASPLGVEQPVM